MRTVIIYDFILITFLCDPYIYEPSKNKGGMKISKIINHG